MMSAGHYLFVMLVCAILFAVAYWLFGENWYKAMLGYTTALAVSTSIRTSR